MHSEFDLTVLYMDSLFPPHSSIGGSSAAHRAQAHALLTAKNPNIGIAGRDWLIGLSDAEKRYVPFNGAIGDAQLEWFQRTLGDARRSGERCFVFCHLPCAAASTVPSCVLWNCERVLEIMHASAGTVVAYLAGHDHDGVCVRRRNVEHSGLTENTVSELFRFCVFDRRLSMSLTLHPPIFPYPRAMQSIRLASTILRRRRRSSAPSGSRRSATSACAPIAASCTGRASFRPPGGGASRHRTMVATRWKPSSSGRP